MEDGRLGCQISVLQDAPLDDFDLSQGTRATLMLFVFSS